MLHLKNFPVSALCEGKENIVGRFIPSKVFPWKAEGVFYVYVLKGDKIAVTGSAYIITCTVDVP